MTLLWITIALLLFIVWVITLVDLFRQHLGRGRTAAWLLIVLLLPFVGSLLYWFLRKPPPEELRLATDAAREHRDGEPPRPPLGGSRIG